MQWASTRQDLFSPEFCQHFGKLRDETEGHSWKATTKILAEELGDKGLESLKIRKTPIGSGCIAQVYQGKLLEPTIHYPKGTKVAIKVQHPGIWPKVCVDFYIFHKVAKFLEDLPYLGLEYLSLVDSITQFRDVMIPQLDLTIEASHLKRFNKNFASNDQITFPRPLDELTTDKVLVETFSEGTPIIEWTKPGAPLQERKQLATLGLEMTLQMIFCKY
jgi:aarF domain-containing kinase